MKNIKKKYKSIFGLGVLSTVTLASIALPTIACGSNEKDGQVSASDKNSSQAIQKYFESIPAIEVTQVENPLDKAVTITQGKITLPMDILQNYVENTMAYKSGNTLERYVFTAYKLADLGQAIWKKIMNDQSGAQQIERFTLSYEWKGKQIANQNLWVRSFADEVADEANIRVEHDSLKTFADLSTWIGTWSTNDEKHLRDEINEELNEIIFEAREELSEEGIVTTGQTVGQAYKDLILEIGNLDKEQIVSWMLAEDKIIDID